MKLHHAAALAVVWYLMMPSPSFSGSGFGMSPLVVPGTADLEPALPPAKGEASPAEMALYWAETHKSPKDLFQRLYELSDSPRCHISSVGLGIDNDELVWHVGTFGDVASKVFEARIRAEFAKFSDKRVVIKAEGLATAL